jgi:2,4-dichlorophenol 6-monooxygenase
VSEVEIETPVLIVGGGGAGLTASILLSKLGIPSLLISRHAETSKLPKAHILNQRTMEIFTDAGVADAILARSTPPEKMKTSVWYTSLGGPREKGYGRRVASIEAYGGGYADPDYIAASPCPTANLPQIRLEPVLKAYAEERPEATIRFHHELVAVEQDEDGVTATVLDRDTGLRYRVRSSYLFGADGGRTVGDLVGIPLDGVRDLRRMVSVHMTADLTPYITEPDALFWWFVNPDFDSTKFGGALVPMGPDHWGAQSEEWVFSLGFDFDDDAVDPRKVMEQVRAAVGLPDFDPQVHHISQWVMEGLIAHRFRSGRVFLLGDAAHRHTPAGGLGLNSAVHDAYNLCWKVAAVLTGRAGDALLDTYDTERRAVDQTNLDTAVKASLQRHLVDEVLGRSPGNTAEQAWATMRPLFEDLPNSAERKHAVTQAMSVQTSEFRQLGVNFGYSYTSAAVVDDGSTPRAPLDHVRLYEPSTAPGHSLPHAWVERADERFPLGSLVHGGHFVLIAGEEGHPWVEAAEKLAVARNIPLRAVRVGLGDSDLIDMRLAWIKNREISPTGAVLVRPDRYVGFRSLAGVDDPLSTLSSALDQILATNK